MRNYFKLLVASLLVLQVLSLPTSKSFTADLEIVEQDGSAGKVTWNYDARQQAESIIYHRTNGKDTVNVRFYGQGVEFLVVENICHSLPLSEKSILTPSARIAQLTNDEQMIKWTNTVNGPVDASLFAIPDACSQENLQGGIFCSSCLSVSQQVIDLGCNATSAEIANLCGNLFVGICKSVLEQVCSGVCQIEQCSTDVCCDFDLCSGSMCGNSTNTTTSSSSSGSSGSSSSSSSGSSSISTIYDQDEEKSNNVGDGIFCPSCLSVSGQVIALGCNATSSEISNLCGSLFAPVCKQVLETLCSGACNVENCAAQTCCAFDLCSGSTCNTTLSNSPSFSRPSSDVVQLHL